MWNSVESSLGKVLDAMGVHLAVRGGWIALRQLPFVPSKPLICLPVPKKLLGAPGLTTRSKDATRGSWHRY